MFLLERCFGGGSSLGSASSNQGNRISDQENSTLLKIAACIPVMGLIINQLESKSLNKKLENTALPVQLRNDPTLGKILDQNAAPEDIKAACKRAIQLKSIQRDYNKAALVNNLLTLVLVVYGLAMNIIPFFVGAILIGGFSLTTSVFAFVLYSDDSIKRYEKVGLETR